MSGAYEPVEMKQLDYLKTIFQLFLGFLTEAAVAELIQRCLQREGGELRAREFTELLNVPAGELIELISRDGDEEDKVKYLNVFLWRQSHQRIAPDLRISYTFEDAFHNWLIHRQMVANDYDWISLTGTVAHDNDGKTYLAQIETQLSAFESLGDLEDVSQLAMLLNVIGPKIASYAGLRRVMSFTHRIIERREDETMRWVSLPAFMMLVHDLSYPTEESWPFFQCLVRLESNRTIFNYPGWLLGIRMFGQLAKDELQRIDVPGGYDLLEAMASN